MATGSVIHQSHPLMQQQTLSRILTGIATTAAPTAIVELIRWLDSFHFEALVPTRDLARLVAILDEAAQPQLRQAGGLYLSNVFGSRSVRYKALGRDFYASLGRAYDLVLGGLAADFSIAPADPLRIETYMRAVRAAAGEIKWVAFDYQELSSDAWRRAMSAYRLAGNNGTLNIPVNLREGRETRSTVAREFIRLVAMRCASLDQLSPDRIEATDKLVRYLQQSLMLTNEPRMGSQFSLDLDSLEAPRRCLTTPEQAAATLRYFRPADAVVMLGELKQTVADGGLGPLFAGIGVPSVSGAIRHLSRQWGPVPPMRQYRRHVVRGSLALATGLGFIRAQISGGAGLRPAAAWSLRDASRNGFGVVSSAFDPDVCRVGSLVGAHVGETGRWVLALVRRVRSDEAGSTSVGMQTISSEPFPAVLDDGARSWNGILCDPVVRGRPVRIVCEPGEMRMPRPIFAKMSGRTVKLQPGTVLVSGPGYQIIGCNVA